MTRRTQSSVAPDGAGSRVLVGSYGIVAGAQAETQRLVQDFRLWVFDGGGGDHLDVLRIVGQLELRAGCRQGVHALLGVDELHPTQQIEQRFLPVAGEHVSGSQVVDRHAEGIDQAKAGRRDFLSLFVQLSSPGILRPG